MNPVRKVISADSHVIEPPEMWSEYLEVRMKPRAPHIEHGKDDDFYCIDGLEPVKVTVLSAAGVPAEEVKHWRRWDAPGRLKGGWDPVQREKDADRDGVDAPGPAGEGERGGVARRHPGQELLGRMEDREAQWWLFDVRLLGAAVPEKK